MGKKQPQKLTRRPLIGLDIDSSSVRMIRLRRHDDGYAVVAAAVCDIAPADSDPELQRVNTIDAVAACFESLGAGKKMAVCGLRGPEVVVRGFEFPSLPPEETRGAVELETSQMCPFGSDESRFDHQVTSDRDAKTQGFWVAARRSQIEHKRQLVREAGLQCVLMDMDGLALLNCLEQCTAHTADPGGDTPVLLDVGDLHTSVAIVDQSGRPFVRDIRSGWRDIVKQIARETDLVPQDVMAALLHSVDVDAALIRRRLEDACVGLVDEIISTLRFYGSRNRSVRINKMLVCGAFARAAGFIDLLAARLPLDVALWDPVSQMPCEDATACEATVRQAGPALAVAAGLAMRTI